MATQNIQKVTNTDEEAVTVDNHSSQPSDTYVERPKEFHLVPKLPIEMNIHDMSRR